MNKIASREHI